MARYWPPAQSVQHARGRIHVKPCCIADALPLGTETCSRAIRPLEGLARAQARAERLHVSVALPNSASSHVLCSPAAAAGLLVLVPVMHMLLVCFASQVQAAIVCPCRDAFRASRCNLVDGCALNCKDVLKLV